MKKRIIKEQCKKCVGRVNKCPEEQFLIHLKKNFAKMTKEERLRYLFNRDWDRGMGYF